MLGRQTIQTDFPWYTRRFLRNLLGQTTRTLVQSQRQLHSAIEEAPLYLADTRPAMFFGVPHVASVLIIALYGESIVFLGPLWACWVIVPWVAIRIAVRTDYNACRVLVLWAMTKMLAWESFTWFGSSPSPFPINGGKYPRGIWA